MLIATPNLCLDITVRLPRLEPGTVARAWATDTSAGGKGVNAARAATRLGVHPVLTGFLPGTDGRQFELLLDADITFRPEAVEGVLRVATVLLEDDGRVTVVNGRGPDVDGAHWQAFLGRVTGLVPAAGVLVCSGSLPPGVPFDGYRQLVDIGHGAGVPVVVDAAPQVLREALAAQPDLVSPNLSEAEGLLSGRSDEEVDERGADIARRAVEASRRLYRSGARRAVVTAGAAGSALTTAAGSWWLPSPRVAVVNPIGAGDSFAAGAALALQAGATDLDVVRRGMAAASASCETATAGRLDAARAAVLFERIRPEFAGRDSDVAGGLSTAQEPATR